MAKRVFRDYAEVNEKLLEGFTVTKVSTGINAEGSGMMLELERTIDNVTTSIEKDCDSNQISHRIVNE